MKRDYDSGVSDEATFFTGIEIEKTAAYGLKTLFVNEIQSVEEIRAIINDTLCEHVYLGANHSYKPSDEWHEYIRSVLKLGILTTIDFDVKHIESIAESNIIDYWNVICQISVKIPNVAAFGSNTSIKIDDKDFNATNAGVWCHDLGSLLDNDRFTNWEEYKDDTIIS